MKRKKMKWSFDRIRPILQWASIILGGFAMVGWTFAGIWFLWIVMQ